MLTKPTSLHKSFIAAAVVVMVALIHPSAAPGQNRVDALVVQAEAFSRQEGKEYLAVSYINEAIKLEPKREDLYYRRAFILGRASLYAFAIRDFSRFVGGEKYPHAIRFRGDCYLGMGDYSRAAKDYADFVRKAPSDGKVWFYLAEALTLGGNSQGALEAIAKGLAANSHWSDRLRELQEAILMNQTIKPHRPLSN